MFPEPGEGRPVIRDIPFRAGHSEDLHIDKSSWVSGKISSPGKIRLRDVLVYGCSGISLGVSIVVPLTEE